MEETAADAAGSWGGAREALVGRPVLACLRGRQLRKCESASAGDGALLADASQAGFCSFFSHWADGAREMTSFAEEVLTLLAAAEPKIVRRPL